MFRGRVAEAWRRRVSEAFDRFGLAEPDETPDGMPTGYKEVLLSIPACDYLLKKLPTAFGKELELRNEIVRAVELGRYYELPLSDSPWLDIESEAARQGVSPADVVFDRAGRHHEPAAPRKRRTA
jgi:hypothetical protein